MKAWCQSMIDKPHGGIDILRHINMNNHKYVQCIILLLNNKNISMHSCSIRILLFIDLLACKDTHGES